MVLISCIHCGNQLQVDESYNGQNITCPVCGQPFTVNLSVPVDPMQTMKANVMHTAKKFNEKLRNENLRELSAILLIIAFFTAGNAWLLSKLLRVINPQIFNDVSDVANILRIGAGLAFAASFYIAVLNKAKLVAFASGAMLVSVILGLLAACKLF